MHKRSKEISTYVRMHIFMYTRRYVRMYVHMHVLKSNHDKLSRQDYQQPTIYKDILV
jgi:uncharacterized protein YlbG (UPF0298 family)